MQSFQQDCVELALRKFRRGEVDRRTLLAGLAALGVGTFASDEAAAQAARQLVMVNWGGIANQGRLDAQCARFGVRAGRVVSRHSPIAWPPSADCSSQEKSS